jgi:hypothetical protein
MADEQTFEVLLREFRRVGVDPDTFSAMLAVRPEDALHALRDLPDDAGASAFLRRLRQNGLGPTGEAIDQDGAAPHSRSNRPRKNKSA